MRAKIIGVLLMLLLSILTTACSNKSSNPNVSAGDPADHNISATVSPTIVPTIIPTSTPTSIPETSPIVSRSEADLAMEAYKRVIQNEDEFYNSDENKKLLLEDYLKENFQGMQLELAHFTVIDMDNDNIPEVILELSIDGYPEFYEILHYSNSDEQVYGFKFVYRGLEQLKTDGTFWASSGVADNECDKLKFSNGVYETITLAHSESKQDSNGMTVSHYIDNRTVTEEEFDSFSQKQNEKDDVVWTEVTQSNIETGLSVGE
ncbi:MAG: hypothetical protein K0S04_1785 [Herbinix sp.]|nr:hypothetical protein [Herbinix sp.]